MPKHVNLKQAGLMFKSLVVNIGKDHLNEILFNWNESELNEDGTEMRTFVDSRGRGPRTGGASRVSKTEFINWLLSDAPFDTKVYGKNIAKDKEWSDLIGRAKKNIAILQK